MTYSGALIIPKADLTHLQRVDSSTTTQSISNSRFSLLLCFIEISVSNANNVDLDHKPLSAASDLGLYCLSRDPFRGL